ncbi:MAG: hypothetical protein AB7T10_09620 [bacterium]
MNKEKKNVENLINSLAWAAFFIMTGILLLMPDRAVPDGTWLISTGAIMLSANLIKNFMGIKTSSGYFFGTIFTLFGIMRLVETPFQFLPIFLISIGSLTIISGLLEIRFKSSEKKDNGGGE